MPEQGLEPTPLLTCVSVSHRKSSSRPITLRVAVLCFEVCVSDKSVWVSIPSSVISDSLYQKSNTHPTIKPKSVCSTKEGEVKWGEVSSEARVRKVNGFPSGHPCPHSSKSPTHTAHSPANCAHKDYLVWWEGDQSYHAMLWYVYIFSCTPILLNL